MLELGGLGLAELAVEASVVPPFDVRARNVSELTLSSLETLRGARRSVVASSPLGGVAVWERATLVVAPLLGLSGVYVGYMLNARREDRVFRRELAMERYRAGGQALFDELIANAGKRYTAM